MAYRRTPKIYMADFETTVTGKPDQADTEVWAAALVEIFAGNDIDDTVYIDNSIEAFMARLNYTTSVVKTDLVVYFHNLKFDGSFIVDYLLRRMYSTALDDFTGLWREDKYMSKKSFKCVISDKGQWYTIKVKLNSGYFITFKDSLKLLPFSVKEIGKGFQTKHKKLDMEYVGSMHAGGTITEEQKKYITNDVLVVKEALEMMFADGYDNLTIGSCCKAEYKKTIMDCDLASWYPSMYNIKLEDTYGAENADDYIRKSYKGGWCYLKEGCENHVFTDGCTADVNSLYPSMMISRDYPVGKPVFFKGDIPDKAKKPNTCYFVRIKTRFYLKQGYLPTIQIKGSPYYQGNEWLKSSDFYHKGVYYKRIKRANGVVEEIIPTLTLTQMDYELLKKHYDLQDTEILDGCYFYTCSGSLLFGQYINQWAEVKKNSTGAKRQEAKLFLNNLYGKFASRVDATTKLPYIGDDNKLHYKLLPNVDPDKEWYIPVGSYVTSWARCFTITAAQENYDRFIYADTDSIHCTGSGFSLKSIDIHAVNFNAWAIEAEWDKAIFVRQKTYIEHTIREMNKTCEMEDIDPYYNIKCAGMGKRPKELLESNLSRKNITIKDKSEQEFFDKPLTLTDFKIGLQVPSNLKARIIPGGTLLKPQPYVMR